MACAARAGKSLPTGMTVASCCSVPASHSDVPLGLSLLSPKEPTVKSTNDRFLCATVISALSLIATNAQAQTHPEKPTYSFEKCYGVAKAGVNDCFTANNSCAGTSKQDGQKDAWVYIPKGTCLKLVGGSLAPPNK
jgi:uncharacterized membrane protein